ncbi:Rpn family recombination-promoting nuclease/putative transposase [Treponema sp. TIM-1]|uniref:Rpn family recombination-promoting nuclease/putative transposase n=1 Tax=Treponema sp. TIM-1 TaxID=2898417 RepID=UPI00398156AC
MSANREYKDSVFSWLFSNPDTLRELYGALSGVTLPPDVPITINTLEGTLFKGRMNDISFIIGGLLVVLIEHQSTINENMPLRLLLYVARLYERITDEKNIYRGKRVPLPLPEFIVLYNGAAPYPDETTLKLSDAFHDPAELGITKGDISLELTVKVYNINRGHNEPIIRRCKALAGYSAFIATVREYEEAGKSREEAIKQAVKECIKQNILKEFLEIHSTEVMNMLFTEWNWDDALAIQREEGMEEGLAKGREEGLEEGLAKGRQTGWEEAKTEYAEQLRQVQEQIRQLEEENRRLRER